jgi:hypothetical protein
MFCESKLGLIKLHHFLLHQKTNCFTYSSSLIHPSLFQLYHHNFQILQLCSKYRYGLFTLSSPSIFTSKPSGYYLECPSIDHQALKLRSHILLQLYIKYIKPFGFLFFFFFLVIVSILLIRKPLWVLCRGNFMFMYRPVSGASMNPARSLGAAIVANSYHGIWIYMLAPTIGALAGAWIHKLVQIQ